jgi:hypothetical protein
MLSSAPTRTAELQAMREDIQQALKKPMNQRSWIMVINTRKCRGVHGGEHVPAGRHIPRCPRD